MRSRTMDSTETYGLPSGMIPTWEWCVHDAAPSQPSSGMVVLSPVRGSISDEPARLLTQEVSVGPQIEIELMVRTPL